MFGKSMTFAAVRPGVQGVHGVPGVLGVQGVLGVLFPFNSPVQAPAHAAASAYLHRYRLLLTPARTVTRTVSDGWLSRLKQHIYPLLGL